MSTPDRPMTTASNCCGVVNWGSRRCDEGTGYDSEIPPWRYIRGSRQAAAASRAGPWASNRSSSSSRVVPFVSGTNLRTNSQDPTLTATNSANVPVEPSAEFSTGNRNEISALVHHSTNTAIPIANPRMLSGKISDSSSHTQVPMNIWTKATNTTMQARIM